MSTLFAGEESYVYDASNIKDIMGDGREIYAGGDRRLFSRLPPPKDAQPPMNSTPFEDAFEIIPRSKWDEMIDAQIANGGRVSDYQNFAPYDQNGLPTCWANGVMAAAATKRVQMGYAYKQISSCSVAVPISGGHSGGWETDALNYLIKYGGVSTDLWPNNSTDRSLMKDPKCQADRKNFMALEYLTLNSRFETYATAALLGIPVAVAYNDWSHVVMGCDLVRISAGKYGYRIRNNWGNWGSKNAYGHAGYAVFAEGAYSHGCPDSGVGIRQMTAYAG